MANSALVFLYILICFASGCFPNEDGIPKVKLTIKGKVVDLGTPLKGVKVTMRYGIVQDSTFTNEKGDYTMSLNAPPEVEQISVRFYHWMYYEVDTVLSFRNSKFAGGGGELDKGEATEQLNVTLKAKNTGPDNLIFVFDSIKGKVLSETNAPLEGMRIFYNDYYIAYSDTSGNFSMEVFGIKPYLLKIEDVDSAANEWYEDKDTLVNSTYDPLIIKLSQKQ